MTAIPGPLALICRLRGIVWSISLRKAVVGHRFVETDRSQGQPRCVRVLECRDCGTVSVGWETCSKC
jgi:hypothetical protein